MTRRATPEADAQRAIVQALRFALPRTAIVHHAANEITGGDRRAKIRQSILVGMGVHPGFADLIVLSGGRLLFLEVKSSTGRLRPSQEAFRDTSARKASAGPWCGRSRMRWSPCPIMGSSAGCMSPRGGWRHEPQGHPLGNRTARAEAHHQNHPLASL